MAAENDGKTRGRLPSRHVGRQADVNAITCRRCSASLALALVALAALTACTDKGSTVDPTTTSPSPTTVQTSKPMLPSSSVASASPEPGNAPT